MRKQAGSKSRFFNLLGHEDRLQAAVIHYVKVRYPGAIILHVPNEGARTPFERYKNKVLGISAGFPDLMLFYKGRIIALELKYGKNKPTANQLNWLDLLNKFGIPAVCSWSFDHAQHFIDYYFTHDPTVRN